MTLYLAFLDVSKAYDRVEVEIVVHDKALWC